MRVKKIKFDKNGHPTSMSVKMSVDEAGVLAKVMGQHSPAKFAEKFPQVDSSVLEEIYGCLVGEFFNHYWDDGVDDWLRGSKPNHGGDF